MIVSDLCTALADRLQSCEVNNTREVILLKNASKCFSITNIFLMNGRTVSENFLDSGERSLRSIGEVIEDDRLVARLLECDDRMRSEISSTPGDEKCVWRHKNRKNREKKKNNAVEKTVKLCPPAYVWREVYLFFHMCKTFLF